MYDNILHQSVLSQLKSDLEKEQFPRSVLFSGPQLCGKLSAALETARIISCVSTSKANWNCNCSSCIQHKSLINPNLIVVGPRDCTPEISASSYAFLNELANNSNYLIASRYLFLRSVRKLTMRFNPILWNDDDKLGKIATIMADIDEELEIIDFPRKLPEIKIVEKTLSNIIDLCQKLEDTFLYDSIPISQIRNINSWSRLKTIEGKKTVIIENADRMLEGVRNALLKILEEPPADTVFILTTTRRSAVMPTILSRVRTYTFTERSVQQQHDVISRVFHKDSFTGTINEYLLTFLPVQPDIIRTCAKDFFANICEGHIPDIQSTIKNCKNFNPKVMFRIFLTNILDLQKKLFNTANGVVVSFEIEKIIQNCWNNVTIYNQSIQSSLEVLTKEFLKINKIYGNVLSCEIM